MNAIDDTVLSELKRRSLVPIALAPPPPAGFLDRAETVLGVLFPASFRAFLSAHNGAMIGDEELLGLPIEWGEGEQYEDLIGPNILTITLVRRKRGLPETAIVLMTNDDETFLLHTKDAIEPPIIRVSAEDNPEHYADSFRDFLFKREAFLSRGVELLKQARAAGAA